MKKYTEFFYKSLRDPEAFWEEAANNISWNKHWEKILDRSKAPLYRWFVGGELNTCFNAVDRHIEGGRGKQLAVIYDSPTTGVVQTITYQELFIQVRQFAGALNELGLVKGDIVIIYMPMIPQTIIAMLSCARLGIIHSVVFGGFAAKELATRIDDTKPKLIITASCGIEGKKIIEYKPLLDKAISLAIHKPEKTIVFQRSQSEATLITGKDLDFNKILKNANPIDCVSVKATDPLYILHTSGTTAIPKGVVRDNGGHAVALYWSMKYIYNIEPGDVYWAASDIGWVVGHSYIVYGPLLYGATTVIYEGKPIGTPDPGAFWRLISQHRVRVLFTAPTALRAIKREDPEGKYLKKYNLTSLKYLFLAGERTDSDTYHWASNMLGRSVIDHWWQTETGWPIAANCLGIEQLPIKPGSPTKGVPGYDIRILSGTGSELAANQNGLVTVKLPLPPGTLLTLWQGDKYFLDSYLNIIPGYYLTGDEGYKDEDGYIYIMGRCDDVINVAGHRFSTGAIEEVIASHPNIAECAVIGVIDGFKGQLPLGLVVLKAGANRDHLELKNELIQLVREQIGAVASFKEVAIVECLPKTRSGKILRNIMRRIADAASYTIPSTIDDPSSLEEIKRALGKIGYGKLPLKK